MDATTGRFLSEDPIRFRAGDQNLYRYVFNNPSNFADPSGEIIPGLFGKGAFDFAADLVQQLAENGGNTDCLDFGQAGKAALEGLINPFSKASKVLQAAKKIAAKKHTPGKGHRRKSDPQKQERFQKKAQEKRNSAQEGYDAAKAKWESLSNDAQKLQPELNPDGPLWKP